MLLRQLRYFLSVVRTGSFTEAAEENYISQSAVSQQIRALEEEIGAPLLLRDGRRATPTPVGEYVYRRGLVLLEESEQLLREASRMAGGDDKSLRIGWLVGFDTTPLESAVARFLVTHPDINVTVKRGSHGDLSLMRQNGEADICVLEQRKLFNESSAVNLPLSEEGMYVELSRDSILSELDSITADELYGIPCILVSTRVQQSAESDYYRDYYGVGREILFAESIEDARMMASARRGYFLCEGESDCGPSLKRLAFTRNGKQLTRNYFAVWTNSSEDSLIREFAETLRDVFVL